MRVAWRILAGVFWAVLAGAALIGVLLASAAFLASAPFTRPFVAGRIVRILDDQIQGHLQLEGIEVLPHGGIQLRGLEVYDPDGHLVLSVERAQVSVDLTALRRRAIGITVELDSPTVLLEEERGGGVSIARAFAPTSGERPRPEGAGGSPWTLHVSRLTLRSGEIWWSDGDGGTRLQATGIDLDGRGLWGPRLARVDLRARGELDHPVAAPFSLEVLGGIVGDAARLTVLRAELGRTALSTVGEGDLARRSGRVAVTRLAIARDVAHAIAPRTPEGADLAATFYAESDGSIVTAALRAEPVEGEAARGRADAAVASRVASPGSSVGFDVALEHFDPSTLAAELPGGDVTLTARGAAAGRSLHDLRARFAATVQRSRLRKGEIGRAEVTARADRGTIEVSRATVSAPGFALDGALRWREGGEVSGRASLDASSLGTALANVGGALGRPIVGPRGRARIDATLAGTSSIPALSARIDAPLLGVGGIAFSGARLAAAATGPLRTPTARVEGTVDGVWSGATAVARSVAVRAALEEDAGSVSATATLPGFRDPASLAARGRLSPARDALLLADFAVAYPGTRWTLAAPASITLAGPSVDRLELRADAQRIAVSGGIGRRGALDARAEIARLDLARLPVGPVAKGMELRGEVSADARAIGTVARPEVSASFSLVGGAFRNLTDLAAAGSARWDGPARRASAQVSLERAGASTIDVDADLPLPLAGRPAERVKVTAKARGVDVKELLAAVGSATPIAGILSLDAKLDGTVGAPAVRGQASLTQGQLEDLDGIGVDLVVDDPGERLRVTARASYQGTGVAAADLDVPLDVSDLLVRPGETAREMRTAPIEGRAAVTALDLRRLAGHAGVPAAIAGILDVDAAFAGSMTAPRGKVTLALAGGEIAGYRRLGGRIDVAFGAADVSASGRVTLADEEAARLQASLGAPVERIKTLAALGTTPLRVDVTIPKVALERASSSDLPLSGTVSGKLTAAGTARAPEVTFALDGQAVEVEGKPLGDARVEGRYARARADAEALVRPPGGGTLRATFGLDADLGVGARRASLRDAPAEVAATADSVDLGFLAAVAPRVVRSAGGKLAMDVRARGPLARMSPRGALHVSGGRLAISEVGEWTDIAIDVGVTDDAVEVSRVEVHRGSGRVTANAALRGLRSDHARLEAHLASDGFTLARAGMDLAKVDLRVDATGSYADHTLSVDVTIPQGVIRLPKKTPRALQPIENRPDIIVGRREERRRSSGGEQPARGEAEKPFTLEAHVVAPKGLFVKDEDPRIDVELKADVRYELTASADYAEGSIEVIRGLVEPVSGRSFTIERGRVQFTGGPPRAALLDVQARYDNPVAVVTVTAQGPLTNPEIRLSSQPPLEDAQIAMLIATGRTELKPGSGGVGTITGEEAGKAALGALATQVFRNLVANKLPLDTVAVDSGALRAGKYVTDKIYVAYVRRFDAVPERGENTDEVRVEYQISRRWTFESRYGNAQSGGASLIWSKDY